jgi:hypothetical protein
MMMMNTMRSSSAISIRFVLLFSIFVTASFAFHNHHHHHHHNTLSSRTPQRRHLFGTKGRYRWARLFLLEQQKGGDLEFPDVDDLWHATMGAALNPYRSTLLAAPDDWQQFLSGVEGHYSNGTFVYTRIFLLVFVNAVLKFSRYGL